MGADLKQHWETFREQQRAEIATTILELIDKLDAPVSVAEICDRAQISRPTFYKYFGTLGGAMLVTHHFVLDELNALAANAIASPGDGMTRLLAEFIAVQEVARTRPDLLRFSSYFDHTFRRTGLTSAELDQLHALEQARTQPTIELFLQGQRDGSIRPDLDPLLTITAMGMSTVSLAQRLLSSPAEQLPGTFGVNDILNIALAAWRSHLTPRNGPPNAA